MVEGDSFSNQGGEGKKIGGFVDVFYIDFHNHRSKFGGKAWGSHARGGGKGRMDPCKFKQKKLYDAVLFFGF